MNRAITAFFHVELKARLVGLSGLWHNPLPCLFMME